MDTWTDLCRCCLSSNCTVSLLDADNNKLKFFEITTIEVKNDDGLPHMLCTDCFAIMNSAYQFKKQCIRMDADLKEQLNILISQSDEAKQLVDDDEEDIANDPMKQLEAIVKTEPADSDDECYYVLVIDDNVNNKEISKDISKDKPIEVNLSQVKVENPEPVANIEIPVPTKEPSEEVHQKDNRHEFENRIESFLVSNSTKVPVNVPATILENEEESQEDDSENFNMMDVDTQDSNSQEQTIHEVEEYQGNPNAIEQYPDQTNSTKNLIKILTATTSDGTILLKDADGIEYVADTQMIANVDGKQLDQEQVILYEGDNPSPFEILKVIEYADEGQIATVVQRDDGTFLCDCGEEFEDLSEFEKHQFNHNPAGDHLCNLCGKGFETAEILAGHSILHNVTGLLVACPFCNQVFRRNTLTQHIKHVHNHIKPRCDVCAKTFANPNNLKRHMMIHSGIREFECDLCFKRFHQKITMQTHRLTHVNPYSCNQCDEVFEDKETLASHKESGNCSKSKVLKVKKELMKTVKQEIITTVGKLLGYACSLCKKMFSLESALEQHVEQNHMLDPAELICPECGEVLPSKKAMQSHIATHKSVRSKQIKRFECGMCGKRCSSQAMLIMHERVHTNERPFPCQLCHLRFKTKTHLRTHQLTHTREKKFGCSVCMKFFALKGNLVVHLRTHTGERPYVCSICEEAFIDSKYLKKHKLKKHSIENVPWNKYTE
ncbi:unnamed protein product [Chilo suppressalis]|uniref:Protein krueppel n=1 Tax=Chilo suppressalis TaxID=168631 RepID=A0ABN8B7J7_CHISP|nr:hypothetical protein evm_012301 [Chilo suppressalis]CAH0403046.1 unnamed protein product [Chilo suppressalis]